MLIYHFILTFGLFIQFVLSQTDSTFTPTSPPSSPPSSSPSSSPPPSSSETTTPAPGLLTIQFIVGMSMTGGVALMVILFMSITACQRAYKNRPKKPVAISSNNIPKIDASNAKEVSIIEKKDTDKPVENIEIVIVK